MVGATGCLSGTDNANAGIVDPAVKASEFLDGPPCKPVDLLLVGDVGRNEDRPATGGIDFGGDLGEGDLVAGCKNDAGPAFSCKTRSRKADA